MVKDTKEITVGELCRLNVRTIKRTLRNRHVKSLKSSLETLLKKHDRRGVGDLGGEVPVPYSIRQLLDSCGEGEPGLCEGDTMDTLQYIGLMLVKEYKELKELVDTDYNQTPMRNAISMINEMLPNLANLQALYNHEAVLSIDARKFVDDVGQLYGKATEIMEELYSVIRADLQIPDGVATDINEILNQRMNDHDSIEHATTTTPISAALVATGAPPERDGEINTVQTELTSLWKTLWTTLWTDSNTSVSCSSKST